jgi:hypothetical protein
MVDVSFTRSVAIPVCSWGRVRHGTHNNGCGGVSLEHRSRAGSEILLREGEMNRFVNIIGKLVDLAVLGLIAVGVVTAIREEDQED